MAKTESTAVNQLIANIQGRPLERAMDADDHDVDLSFEERTIPVHEPNRRTGANALAPQAAPPPPMPRNRSAAGTEVPALTSSARTTTTRPTTIPPLPPSNPRATMAGIAPGPTRSSTLPPPLRHSAPSVRSPEGTPAPELLRPSAPPPPPPRPSSPNEAPAWLATPVPSLPQLPPRRPYPDATAPAALVDGQDWFESSQAVPSLDEAEIGTQGVRAKKRAPIGFLVGTGLVFALAGVFVGGYLTFDGAGGAKPAPTVAPVAAAMPAPAAGTAPAVEPAKTEPAAAAAAVVEPEAAKPEPAAAAIAAVEPEAAKPEPAAVAAEPEAAKPEPAAVAAVEPAKTEPTPTVAADPAVVSPAAPVLVDVLFLSTPIGANVVLVDGGRTIPIGPTPVSASIDVSHSYEAVFALDGHQTLIKQLDPRRDRRFSVDLKSGKTKIKHGAPVLAAADADTVDAKKSDAKKSDAKKSDSRKSDRAARAEEKKAEKAAARLAAEEKKADKAAAKLAAKAEKAEKSAARRDKSNKKVATVDWTEEAKKLESADPIGEPTKAETKTETVAAKVEPKKPEPAAVAKTGPKQQASDDEDPIATPKKATTPKPAPAPAPKVAAAPAAGGEGVLMVASKPPCDIIIDGKSTGLTTPQRSIELSAGTHKVTLVNKEAGIKKTIAVKVSAGKPTKLIQDYTSEMK